jgi:hypothetical protein
MKKFLACFVALGAFVASSFADTAQVVVKGEVVDMACYLDHGAHGDGHAACAAKCISSGLPVGIKSADGKVYLLIGAHKPMNDQLAAFAGKTISVQGKLATRDGISLLENATILKD